MNNKQRLLDLEIKNIKRDLQWVNKEFEYYTDYTWDVITELVLNIFRFIVWIYNFIKYWYSKIKLLNQLRKKNNEL